MLVHGLHSLNRWKTELTWLVCYVVTQPEVEPKTFSVVML